MLKVLLLNFLVVALFCDYGQAARTLHIRNFNMCNGRNYTYTADVELKNSTNGQDFKLTAYLKKDLGNDNKFLCKGSVRRGQRLVWFGSLPGKGLCKAFSTYGGSYWDDISEKIGNKQGCPIVAKTWYLNWYPVIYVKIPAFRLVPSGTYFINCYLTDLTSKLITGCLSFDVTLY